MYLASGAMYVRGGIGLGALNKTGWYSLFKIPGRMAPCRVNTPVTVKLIEDTVWLLPRGLRLFTLHKKRCKHRDDGYAKRRDKLILSDMSIVSIS